MSTGNKFTAIMTAFGLAAGMLVSATSFAHGGGHHGGGHHGGGHHGGHHHSGHHSSHHHSSHHHNGHHSSYHGHNGGYHHGYHGYRGNRGYGWYGSGYVAAPGVNRACHWVPRHRNNNGVWIPARKVCRAY